MRTEQAHRFGVPHTLLLALAAALLPLATASQSDGPDIYEDDDLPTRANWIGMNAVADQTRNFHDSGDVDWVIFYAEVTDDVVTVETNNLGPNCDTYVELYRGDGATRIWTNDDRGLGDFSSYLTWNIDADGFYLVRVSQSPLVSPPPYGEGTQYDLRVWRESAPALPGTLAVTVVNTANGAIPGARVSLMRNAPYWTFTQLTGPLGSYQFMGLDAGSYSVAASADGYATSSPETVAVSDGGYWDERITLNIESPTLDAAPLSINVSPDGGALEIAITNSGLGMLIWQAQVTDGGDWLHITSATTGTGNGKVTLNCDANTSSAERRAYVRVTATDKHGATAAGSPKDVEIIQAGIQPPDDDTNSGGDAGGDGGDTDVGMGCSTSKARPAPADRHLARNARGWIVSGNLGIVEVNRVLSDASIGGDTLTISLVLAALIAKGRLRKSRSVSARRGEFGEEKHGRF